MMSLTDHRLGISQKAELVELRLLVLAAAVAVDTALKQDDRGPDLIDLADFV